MKKIIGTIYWMYKSNGKTNDIPYVRTLTTFVGLIFLHICQIILIFNVPLKNVFPFELPNPIHQRWLNGSFVLTPLIILFLVLAKKKALDSYPADEKEIKRARKILPAYFILSLMLLLILIIKRGIQKNLI
jgi:hypothetical protein